MYLFILYYQTWFNNTLIITLIPPRLIPLRTIGLVELLHTACVLAGLVPDRHASGQQASTAGWLYCT